MVKSNIYYLICILLLVSCSDKDEPTKTNVEPAVPKTTAQADEISSNNAVLAEADKSLNKEYASDGSNGIQSQEKSYSKPKDYSIEIKTSNMPNDIKTAIESLLKAYNQGDGETAYNFMDTPREKRRIINAFKLTVPIKNPVITLIDKNSIKIEYKMAKLGDIITLLFNTGCDESNIKAKFEELYMSDNLETRSEVWNIVRENKQIKFKFNDQGILRFGDLIGTDIHGYCNDVDWRKLADRRSSPNDLPYRVTDLMFAFFKCYNIKQGSAEEAQTIKEVFTKIKPVLATSLKLIETKEYSIEIPNTWQDILTALGKANEIDGIMYGGFNAANSIVAVGIKKELDASTDVNLKNESDEFLLLTFSVLYRDNIKLKGKVLDSGASTVAGIPAKFFVVLETEQVKTPRRFVSYLFVKNKIAYSLRFMSDDSQFDQNYDLFMRIKSTFQFKRQY